jgi:hypothetical protein
MIYPDIIHRFVFYLKHKVLESGFCLRLQVEPTQLGPIEKVSISGQDPETSSFYWAHLSRFRLKTETESGLQNLVLNKSQEE